MKSAADEQKQTSSSEETPPPEAVAGNPYADEASSGSPPAEEAQEPSNTEAEDRETAQEGETDELEALRAELQEKEEEQEALNDRLLRTAAELQNVRRRATEEQRRRAAAAKAGAVRPMLDVMDDFERTLSAAEDVHEQQDAEAAFRSLRDGVAMVAEKFRRTLSNLGVEPIEAEGRSFDENEHEAMMQRSAPEGVSPGTVLDEVRTGYRMDDRILRHSRVVVASDPSQEATGEETAEEGKSAEE